MDRPSRHSLRPPAWSTLLALIATALALLAPAAARAGVFVGNPVAGPTAALHQLDGIDLAPDGTGALVFAMDDGGVPHMFVSRLVNGAWNPPERLDADLGTPATQASVAAGDGGRVVVAFANGGNLYVATRASAATGWGRQTLWSGGGASDPSADLSVNGKGTSPSPHPGPAATTCAPPPRATPARGRRSARRSTSTPPTTPAPATRARASPHPPTASGSSCGARAATSSRGGCRARARASSRSTRSPA